ncbi:zinc ribbon domain-containing protein [Actomonas aquatica]|uniref:C4-type zinc ribbon domain-containing protein n=1 Tax=Actomonas aquatica TaxID=2866162 RepID=A0ABZ1C591_9BACT|nr:C4-type zinc ribbon domain-containing protein [Opitutus sp. WL0086]WRQ86779.1 C4-type zinc ribbon domain-containing protein [Opitutus sp. WL0086]
MRHPAIEPILVLQDREQARRGLVHQIEAIPGDVGRVQAKIDAEKAAIETAKTEWRELETKKKLLETEIGTAEDKLAKYKTQQSLVKKNDEYQALGQEIESMEGKIGELEGQELEIMYAIDAAKERFNAAETSLKENISGHEEKIAVLRERETNLKAELAEVEAAVAAAREPISERYQREFDRIAERQFPVCVAIEGGNCSGCHLKVSGEIDSVARKGEELAKCDQCGRIVWFQSA